MTVHLERIPPGSNPGALYVRVCTVSGELLADHPLGTATSAHLISAVADLDILRVSEWMSEHPGDEVHTYIYDGDSGECLRSIITR